VTTGTAAPTFRLTDTAGGDHDLARRAGSPATVVVFTCNHCPYALAWHDRIAAVADDYADRGVEVWCISSNDAERFPGDSPEAMRERVEREGWRMPYLYDESQDVAHAYSARTTPHVFVLDPELRVRYGGAPDADHEAPSLGADWMRSALDAVLDGSEPDPAKTKPVGCTIMWRK
jgi:peroxiredoxin